MPDPSAVDNALIAKLLGDATLTALMPDGVYWDEAPAGVTRFVIVTLVDHVDVSLLGGRGMEDALYLVKAVALSTSGADIKGAADRLDTLLENGALTVAGYTLVSLQREERLRATEVDSDDRTLRWFHRGGRYRIVVALT